RDFSLMYSSEDVATGKPHEDLAIAARDGRVETDGWRTRKDGSQFWANTVISVLRDDQGAPRGYAQITRDLTKRRTEEEKLRQSEEVFRLLVASVKDYAIFLLDPT